MTEYSLLSSAGLLSVEKAVGFVFVRIKKKKLPKNSVNDGNGLLKSQFY